MDLLALKELSFCYGAARIHTHSSLLIISQTQDIFLQAFGTPASQNKYYRHSDPSLRAYHLLFHLIKKEQLYSINDKNESSLQEEPQFAVLYGESFSISCGPAKLSTCLGWELPILEPFTTHNSLHSLVCKTLLFCLQDIRTLSLFLILCHILGFCLSVCLGVWVVTLQGF